MRVDFYQLSRDPAEAALPLIARNVMNVGERLLVVAADPQQRQRICQALWSLSSEAFLANGMAGEGDEERQPILLSDTVSPLNGAKFLAIADGQWREGETPFERTFFLFDGATVQHARDTWRMLRGRQGVEHFYWKQEGGRWVQAG
ncbi:DNA polymerase III subunit chi [Novosphingobium mangrovi (ex Huang et al. 2023)]|uniref:DNA polymerase III subunit chi n=1 Tax=Novosphingobium mangrovi (ex Huang et al. 2023) TaxID=2976432 RepID=A0ABT2I6P5_9SPHN|nr:DNA polymerase III subunit chi [Novosphingobium mangrovi (ex Huang et al. 2023)]MCT2400487.1 DNA polymerase III subunit chi [Novosphingobium mangrovi (ex Huang et al. 2023)]